MASKCPRCVNGQMFEDGEGRVSCVQCGHDPQMAWFRENRLPDVEVLKLPGGARESMGAPR